jgi:hypothetical protein
MQKHLLFSPHIRRKVNAANVIEKRVHWQTKKPP